MSVCVFNIIVMIPLISSPLLRWQEIQEVFRSLLNLTVVVTSQQGTRQFL